MNSKFVTKLFFYAVTLCLGAALSRTTLAMEKPPVIEFTADRPNDLTAGFTAFVDESGKQDLKDVLSKGLDNFTAKNFILNPGYTSANHWLHVRVRNSSTNSEWYIVPEYPLLKVEAYALNSAGKYELLESAKEFSSRFPIRKLIIKPGDEQDILIKVSSPLTVNSLFNAMTVDQLKDFTSGVDTISGIIAGIFLAMIIYNFFLYATLRDKDHFYYLAFVITNAHIGLLAANYPEGIFGWFGIDWWQWIDVYRPLAPFTMLLFARSFLQTKALHPRLDFLIRVYLGGLVLFMIASFFVPRTVLFPLEDTYFIFSLILVFTAGFQSLRKGLLPIHLYLVGLSSFTIGSFIYIVKSEGLLPTNSFTLNAHTIFHALEMLLMSLALSGKIKQLESKKTEAEITVAVKKRLLRVISHDIANPLSIIRSVAYIIQPEIGDKKKIEVINRAVSVIDEIMKFIRKDDLLDSNEFVAEEVNLAEVFDGLRFVFHKLSAEKNVPLLFDLEKELAVSAEKTSLTYEVLANFIGNAIKFSHSGSSILIRAEEVGSKVRITIKDHGIGMKKNVLENAFNPLINVSRKGTIGEKGGGFGLHIAKSYLDKFNASIQIESVSQDDSADSGTTITILLHSATATVISRGLGRVQAPLSGFIANTKKFLVFIRKRFT